MNFEESNDEHQKTAISDNKSAQSNLTQPIGTSSVLILQQIAGSALVNESQADNVIRTIRTMNKRWIEIDFTGIQEIRMEFVTALMRSIDTEFATAWLVPRHYRPPAHFLVGRLVSRLKRLREEAWRNGFELDW
jgi:hypothetical protein